MLTTPRRFGFFIAFTAILALGTSACSDEDPDTETPAPAAQPAAAAGNGDAGNGDGDGVYGGDLDTLGLALQAGTGADSFSVAGTTVRLHFDEGSVEDPTAHINCSAAGHLLEDGHEAVLVYLDGEKRCSAENSAGSPDEGG